MYVYNIMYTKYSTCTNIMRFFFCIDNLIFIMSNCHNNNNKYHPHPQHAFLVIDC